MVEEEDITDNLEYYKSVNSVDNESPFNEGEEVDAQFKIEFEPVFKTLATGMYDSARAGIREGLTNANTAVFKAIRNHNLSLSEAQIEVTVDKDKGFLILKDNGVGMTWKEIQDIVSVIGVSDTLTEGDLAGQFGMGFLALFTLTGIQGGFIMHTNSRRSDEDPISGFWKGAGFSKDEDGKLAGGFENDQYGTRFEIPLDESIEIEQIGSWVDELCTYSRIPVLYKEKTSGEVLSEEYGYHSLEDNYNSPYIKVETPYFTAYNSNDATNTTILLDVPTDRNLYRVRGAPFRRVDIRMKNENGVVVEGPHEGLIPVEENEYSGIPDRIKSDYVVENELKSSDVVMPGPISNRDKLEKNPEFWDWLANKFQDKFSKEIQEIYSYVDTPEDLFRLDEYEYNLLCSVPSVYPQSQSLQSTFQSEFNISVDKQIAQAIEGLSKSVQPIPNDINNVDSYNSTETKAYSIAYDAWNSDGEVYMGVSLNQKKCEVVWADNEENRVVRVDSTDAYPQLEFIGWNKLKTISKDTIDEFDVPDEIANQFKTNKRESTSVSSKNVVVHFGNRQRSKYDWKVGELKSALESIENGGNPPSGLKNIEKLVVFPSDTNKNISDYYWIGSNRTGLITCTLGVYEYLSESSLVEHIDDYIESANNYIVNTKDGNMKFGSIDNDKIVLHIIDDNYDLFNDSTIMTRCEEYIRKNIDVRYNITRSIPDDMVYVPIRDKELDNIRPVVKGCFKLEGDFHSSHALEMEKLTVSTDTRLYAYGRLYDWLDRPEMNAILNTSTSLDEGGYELVETLRKQFISE